MSALPLGQKPLHVSIHYESSELSGRSVGNRGKALSYHSQTPSVFQRITAKTKITNRGVKFILYVFNVNGFIIGCVRNGVMSFPSSNC